MDKSSAQAKDSTQPDLAQYQAQWTKIHNDTIRQIKQAREKEQAKGADPKGSR
ncbi:uncharacterized protein LDX57_008617 [Aspergillus melleus]|uniref:uncharacterized protein n=1 Tax=Aspergillus melleus TaxID=138277 RepID=UPI001E8D22A9|nr:uncharacterized protein LDX57_008617 [Aspergillus melleus]KAH8430954.1 hypothetical protein LDX57_008617 [Aspergillus melleus]